jgi:hypothetical protein
VLAAAWAASTALLLWRFAQATCDPAAPRCACGGFDLDDPGEVLFANEVLHETFRCSPSREVVA